MEKKIERVPYISKWYKRKEDCSGEHFRLDVERTNQYLKNELLHFDFKDEPTTEERVKELNNCFKNTYLYFDKSADSDCDVDKISVDWLNKDTTSISYPNGIHFWSPQKPQLKFEHHLTQKDVDYLRELLHLVWIDIESIKHVPSKEKDALDRLTIINNYISNSLGIRDKAQRRQLEELIEQSKPKKSYESTLSEHKEELQKLYQIKEQCGFKFIKDFANGNFPYSTTLSPIKEILGIDFIKDFIKACEKCEG